MSFCASHFLIDSLNTDLVNNDKLRGKFWTKRAISNQSVGFKGSTLKGSNVDPSFNYPYGINDIMKKREAINPEPPNPDRLDIQFLCNLAVYKGLLSFLYDE